MLPLTWLLAGVAAVGADLPAGQVIDRVTCVAGVRKTLPFPLFATAGTDDFNHLEMRLRQRWRDLSAQAKNPMDSTQRQIARRVLSALSADGTDDADYAKIIAEYRMPRAPG